MMMLIDNSSVKTAYLFEGQQVAVIILKS